MADYIGQNVPVQVVKIRLGRLTRYLQENPHENEGEGENGGEAPTHPGHIRGAGHQEWDAVNYPCDVHIGTTGSNPWYYLPWQALWLPAAVPGPGEYKVVPNIREVKLDKKGDIGAVATAAIEIDNILYTASGGAHVRERGAMAPLYGVNPPAKEGIPGIPHLEGEAGELIATGEWKGRFAFAAQITIWQGTAAHLVKVFTGLIEDIDLTARPDRITINCRDFGQVFTDTHFFGWGKDPVINTPVVFADEEASSKKEPQGKLGSATSSNEAVGHGAGNVIDGPPSKSTSWQTATVGSGETEEWIEIGLPEGRYRFVDTVTLWHGMEVFISIHPALTAKGGPSRREPATGGGPIPLEGAWLDAGGWVDVTKEEGKLIGGTGISYTNHFASYAAKDGEANTTPLDSEVEGENRPSYDLGPNSVIRITFKKLHTVEGGFRAGMYEIKGLRETTSEAAALAEWVLTNDIADVVRVICQWAGFKEWDIDDTGAKLPVQIVANPAESYLDVIKKLADSIGWQFYMKDPTPDSEPWKGPSIEEWGGSLGVPTFKEARVIGPDTKEELERLKKPAPAQEVGQLKVVSHLKVITDRTLLTAIDVKQSNEPLPSSIRVYGYTLAVPGNTSPAAERGKRLVYLMRPPWAGTAPTYADSRLGGVIKDFVHQDLYLSTPEMVRNAALYIALQGALESITATIDIPGVEGVGIFASQNNLDVEDHVLLMDLGTGLTTRLAIAGRSSTFTDGEKRSFTMQLSGALIDTVDVREMVEIILGDKPANGVFNEWGNTRVSVPSDLGYG